jgi:DNA-3-methyladenine glycosylase II
MIDRVVAERHLARVDPVMRRLIRELGPFALQRVRGMTPCQALIRAVAHQQLHGIAAERILSRLTALTPGPLYPAPGELIALPEATLRAVGFSGAKVRALHDIAAKTVEGVIPSARALSRLTDDAIIERLTAVRGIGRWTAEILLIRIGRPDVLPADDFGVRSGFRAAYRARELPTPKALRLFGERWRPFRTVAAWYLWRAADRARQARRASAVSAPRPTARRQQSG